MTNKIKDLIKELNDNEIEIIEALIRTQNMNLKEALENFEDIPCIYLNKKCTLSINKNLAYNYIKAIYDDLSQLDKDELEKYFYFYSFGENLNIKQEFVLKYMEQIGGVKNLPRETLESYFDYESFGRKIKNDFDIDKKTMIAIFRFY